MERNTHSKVYINPNFRRAETDTTTKTHFNRHYLKEMPIKKTYENINYHSSSSNRIIYVNPIFISANNAIHSNLLPEPANTNIVEGDENVKTVLNIQPIHKSKYSLVCNIQQSGLDNVKKEQTNNDNINKNIDQRVAEELYTKTKQTTYTQEIPLKRSRYCIVRKKKKLSLNEEKRESNPTVTLTNNIYVAPDNNIKTKPNKTPDKITKMKLTKYKTIPISYFKKNHALQSNHNKTIQSAYKTFTKSNSKLSTSTSTKLNKSCNSSIIDASSKLKQYEGKNASINRSKVKLSQAKFNINNIPCRLFKKYGKCLRQEQGNCRYLHDKKHVSLCRKFLKGICHDKDCLLSHEPTSEKMPTCSFYLKRMCTKEGCPYLHVKLNEKTKICPEFLKGYCESGEKCLFKHIMINRLKIRKLALSSQRKCLEKNIVKSKHIKVQNIDKMKSSKAIGSRQNSDELNKNNIDSRYYKELNDEMSFESIKPKRCKLGTLPPFIQL